MTQRSGKFTRGPCSRDEWGHVVDSTRGAVCVRDIALVMSGSDAEIAEANANTDLFVAVFNAATIAEDMGYDGQAAVEALPDLLKMLHLYVYPGGFEGRPAPTETREKGIAVLASCRAKEPMS